LLLGALGLFVTAVAGCGAPCNSSSVCAVSGGTGADEQVCDGSDNRLCNDEDRGLTIACKSRAEVAVCTPNGWAFQPAGTGSGGGG
jgi:hypothetical protein